MYDAVNGAMQLSEAYAYDEKGERRIKLEQIPEASPTPTGNEQVETRYVNQFASRMDTVGGGEMFTKHVFVGNDRIASVLTSPTDPQITFFYHKDHLGSTTYMTDQTGTIKEHIEYTPWGEMWYDVKNTDPVFRPDYYYTGKELDRTGLYYYGARYYDPQTSVWQSPDPALEEYVDSYVGGGGIYNSMNLSMYSYGHQNPLSYVDPDGRIVVEAAPVAVAALAVVGYVAVAQSLQQVKEGGGVDIDFTPPLFKVAKIFLTANEDNNVEAGTESGSDETKGKESAGTGGTQGQGGGDDKKKPKGGETEATKAGKKAHKEYKPGEGFKKEFRLPSGKRADAVNLKDKIVKELKPNTPNAIKKGMKQVEGYKQELQKIEPGDWKSQIETYEPKDYLNKGTQGK